MHKEHGVSAGMNRTSVITMIAAMSLVIAILDYSTSAQLAIPVIFAFPLALCAWRRSKRLLWATAAIAVIESVTAGYWGFHRVMPNHLAGSANRGLVLDSLLGLAALFHLWINKSRNDALELARHERYRLALIEKNERLETELAKMKSSARGKRKAQKKNRTADFSTPLPAPAAKFVGTSVRFATGLDKSALRSAKDSESNGSTGGN
jgi:hypothetical protein